MLMVLDWRSPSVMIPSSYCFLTTATRSCASSMIFCFIGRNVHVADTHGKGGFCRFGKAQGSSDCPRTEQSLQGPLSCSTRRTSSLIFFFGRAIVLEAELFRNNRIENHASRRCFNDAALRYATLIFSWIRNAAAVDSLVCSSLTQLLHTSCSCRWHAEPTTLLLHRGKLVSSCHALQGNKRIMHQVIETQGHILRRNCNRFSGRRQEDIIRRHHQEFSFQLSFDRKRNINRHLVTVEVGVKRCADERMDTDRFSFDQDRLKRLDTQAVKRRRTVEKNRVAFNDLFKNIPHFRSMPLNHFLRRADRIDIAQDLSDASR